MKNGMKNYLIIIINYNYWKKNSFEVHEKCLKLNEKRDKFIGIWMDTNAVKIKKIESITSVFYSSFQRHATEGIFTSNVECFLCQIDRRRARALGSPISRSSTPSTTWRSRVASGCGPVHRATISAAIVIFSTVVGVSTGTAHCDAWPAVSLARKRCRLPLPG